MAENFTPRPAPQDPHPPEERGFRDAVAAAVAHPRGTWKYTDAPVSVSLTTWLPGGEQRECPDLKISGICVFGAPPEDGRQNYDVFVLGVDQGTQRTVCLYTEVSVVETGHVRQVPIHGWVHATEHDTFRVAELIAAHAA